MRVTHGKENSHSQAHLIPKQISGNRSRRLRSMLPQTVRRLSRIIHGAAEKLGKGDCIGGSQGGKKIAEEVTTEVNDTQEPPTHARSAEVLRTRPWRGYIEWLCGLAWTRWVVISAHRSVEQKRQKAFSPQKPCKWMKIAQRRSAHKARSGP
jgi:hypothetical protein